jgi:hypothetical protein
MNWYFQITGGDAERLQDWKDAHPTHSETAIGAGLTYTFTPSSIGTFVSVICSVCKEKFLVVDGSDF